MTSEAEEVVGKTAAATIVMVEIDAIMMLVVDNVTMAMVVMVSERANQEKEACTDRAIGTANQSMTKRGAKLTNFVKKWIELLRNRWNKPTRSKITPRKSV